MVEAFIDTNVFLRFLTNDDPVKAKRAETRFRNAMGGKESLRTSLLVIAEIVWTLESFYKLEKKDIAQKVPAILNTPNLICPEGRLIRLALDLYVEQNIDFIDAYHAYYFRPSQNRHLRSKTLWPCKLVGNHRSVALSGGLVLRNSISEGRGTSLHSLIARCLQEHLR